MAWRRLRPGAASVAEPIRAATPEFPSETSGLRSAPGVRVDPKEGSCVLLRTHRVARARDRDRGAWGECRAPGGGGPNRGACDVRARRHGRRADRTARQMAALRRTGPPPAPIERIAETARPATGDVAAKVHAPDATRALCYQIYGARPVTRGQGHFARARERERPQTRQQAMQRQCRAPGGGAPNRGACDVRARRHGRRADRTARRTGRVTQDRTAARAVASGPPPRRRRRGDAPDATRALR